MQQNLNKMANKTPEVESESTTESNVDEDSKTETPENDEQSTGKYSQIARPLEVQISLLKCS